MENPVIIFGATGLGKVALDIFQSNEIIVYGFLDDDPKRHGTTIDAISVLGNTDDDGFLKLIGKKCEAFVASDDNSYRRTLVEMLLDRRKTMPVNAIHKLAYLASSAAIGHGNLFSAGTIIQTDARVGNHCLFHTGSIVDYEAVVGNFVQVGVRSSIGSGSTIEDGAFIGNGVTVVAGVTIGKKARIGAGSVVIESVKAGATVFGNPAKAI